MYQPYTGCIATFALLCPSSPLTGQKETPPSPQACRDGLLAVDAADLSEGARLGLPFLHDAVPSLDFRARKENPPQHFRSTKDYLQAPPPQGKPHKAAGEAPKAAQMVLATM